MLFRLPPDETLYAALIARDEGYDGRAYVGVTTTGIFCRLTCPARKPRPENCRFFETAGDCVGAGFRPCKRCRPLAPMAASDPVIARLLSALDEAPDHRWTEGDVASAGIDPSTARRVFKRQFGMTFLEMARQRRLGQGMRVLATGGRVIDAQMGAGFDSASAFRDAMARLLGRAPGSFDKGALMAADWIDTPLGPMIAVASDHALHLLEFTDRKALPTELRDLAASAGGRMALGRRAAHDRIAAELARYFEGEEGGFATPLAPLGTAFQRQVWAALRAIPAGETRSYGEVAKAIQRPGASRAVARANGANPIALVVPCHRVIGADGSLTGYGGGLWRKQRLIALEREAAGRV
ncbi:bifunctional transcriptional activator/DNA repair enzyme AdaA [Pseudoroseicyclus aestuarii]|uniref:Methylated-DNA--protein-cysteine methyltransferase n=1 Tax=Pseudoroseicyclus aestuarii TaxID=1795041 RepID=A0A318SRA0_9RHOB|nr:trifunctional transcriptional activator/DNA repair protein Ada/methylated-DNA--[protein]-cysteine S-methyltransferase [Pseudoroseicyclus aestuarii]PYE84122.1 DNA-O6-methylguanine--protein-cysteine S-methyltransferase /transcriptional regulator Ada [Pseudoroseicyclus aestuarii]